MQNLKGVIKNILAHWIHLAQFLRHLEEMVFCQRSKNSQPIYYVYQLNFNFFNPKWRDNFKVAIPLCTWFASPEASVYKDA